MAIKLRSILKGFFGKGKYPTEAEFADFIDSFVHKSEDKSGGLGKHDPLISYPVGVTTITLGKLWVSIRETQGLFNAEDWAPVSSLGSGVLNAFDEYDNAVEYTEGDEVTYGLLIYRALDTTIGNEPTDTDYWETVPFSTGEFGQLWSERYYLQTEVVRYNDKLYECTETTKLYSDDFATELAAGKWKLIAGRQGTPDNWGTKAQIRALTEHNNGDDIGCFDNNAVYQYVSADSHADDNDVYLKPTDVSGNGRWVKQITIALASDLSSHTGNTNNPHSVTKTQVGLSDVTNDAQLKRAAGDFASFTEKTTLADADIILIEDSEATGAKKKVAVSNLGGGSMATTSETNTFYGEGATENLLKKCVATDGTTTKETRIQYITDSGVNHLKVDFIEVKTTKGGATKEWVRKTFTYSGSSPYLLLSSSKATITEWTII